MSGVFICQSITDDNSKREYVMGVVLYYVAGVGAVRLLPPFFFVRITVIGSGVCDLGGVSGLSVKGNEVNCAGFVEGPEVGAGCNSDITATPSGISPSLSTTKDCNENVCVVVLSDGSLLSIKFTQLKSKRCEIFVRLSPWGIGGMSSR